MQNAEGLSRDQIQEFLRSSEAIEFAGGGRDERYGWVERVLRAQDYGKLGKGERGVVRAYVRKVTGLSQSQTTRLIRAYLDHGKVQPQPYQRHCFARIYTVEDIVLLAEVDRAHGGWVGRPRGEFCSAPTNSSDNRSTNGWPTSAWRICTTYGRAGAIAILLWCSSRRKPPRRRLGNVAGPIRKADRAM